MREKSAQTIKTTNNGHRDQLSPGINGPTLLGFFPFPTPPFLPALIIRTAFLCLFNFLYGLIEVGSGVSCQIPVEFVGNDWAYSANCFSTFLVFYVVIFP